MIQLDTVILPVAGLGTRLLPLTKSVPKELLPLYDKPVLQLALEEAIAAGARRIVLITSPEKPAIRAFVARDAALEAELRRKGKEALARDLAATRPPAPVDIHFLDQPQALGLGHAVGLARDYVTGPQFGVILPDDYIHGRPCLAQMAEAHRGGNMIAAMEVGPEQVSSYGIFDLTGESAGPCLAGRGLVEKPAADKAPSRLAAVGRYILEAEVMDLLAAQTPGAGGEIQLTDAIARAEAPLWAFRFDGERFDCGTQDGLLAAGLRRKAERDARSDAPMANVLRMAAE